MKMKFDSIKEFIELAKESGVSELSYETKDEKYFVSLKGDPAVISAPAYHQATEQATSVVNETSNAGEYLEIKSPFVGTFYSSASPGAASYAKVGDVIQSGQVLCIVEAMKIMNEIEADKGGELVEMCVENESYVEFGQVLFKLKPVK